ncbi:MAG: DUF4384 domain-containing protein [Pseudomonadota bacterium]
MKRYARLAAATLAAALTLTGCAAPGSVDSDLLARMDGVMRQAAPGRAISLRLSSDQFRTGEPIAATVSATGGGYVYLYQLGTEGRVLSMVFPNAIDGANYLAPGSAMVLPRPNWRMMARGPAGVGHLLAVVTDAPLDLLALQGNTAQGKIDISGAYGAAMATVREVAP